MKRADDVSIEIAINESQTMTGIESVGTSTDSSVGNQKGILRPGSKFVSSSMLRSRVDPSAQRNVMDYGTESVEINYSSKMTNEDSSLHRSMSDPTASHDTQISKEETKENGHMARLISYFCRSNKDSGDTKKYWTEISEIMSGFIGKSTY